MSYNQHNSIKEVLTLYSRRGILSIADAQSLNDLLEELEEVGKEVVGYPDIGYEVFNHAADILDEIDYRMNLMMGTDCGQIWKGIIR